MPIRLSDTQRRIASQIYNRVLAQTGSVEEAVDVVGMAYQESRFKPTAVGPQTRFGRARGVLQFIDATAKRFGITNPYDINQQVDATLQYRQFLRNFLPSKGVPATRHNLMAAHNAGEGNVVKHRGIPPFKETTNYVRQIAGRQAELIPTAGIKLDAQATQIQPIEQNRRTQTGRTDQTVQTVDTRTVPNTERSMQDPLNIRTAQDVLDIELPDLQASNILSQDATPLSQPNIGAIFSDAIAQQPAMLDAAQVQPGVFETFANQLALQSQPLQDDEPVVDPRRRASQLITGRLINV